MLELKFLTNGAKAVVSRSSGAGAVAYLYLLQSPGSNTLNRVTDKFVNVFGGRVFLTDLDGLCQPVKPGTFYRFQVKI